MISFYSNLQGFTASTNFAVKNNYDYNMYQAPLKQFEFRIPSVRMKVKTVTRSAARLDCEEAFLCSTAEDDKLHWALSTEG